MNEQLDLFAEMQFESRMECPLKGRRVTVTGRFPRNRQQLTSTLKRLGAKEVKWDNLSRGAHFLLVGDEPDGETMNYWQLYRHDGYEAKRITIEDLQKIQDGVYAPYQLSEGDVRKQLHLLKEDIWWKAPQISGLKSQRQDSPLALDGMDVLYGREIFVHPGITALYPTLRQDIGNLGGYANAEMSDEIDSIVIPEALPQEIITAIEDYYNKSRSQQFNIPFIILEDLMEYLDKWELVGVSRNYDV